MVAAAEDLTVREWEWWEKGKERVVGVLRRLEYFEEEERERVDVEGDGDKFKALAIFIPFLLYWPPSPAGQVSSREGGLREAAKFVSEWGFWSAQSYLYFIQDRTTREVFNLIDCIIVTVTPLPFFSITAALFFYFGTALQTLLLNSFDILRVDF
jgi:hypothetical protein